MFSHEYFRMGPREKKIRNTKGEFSCMFLPLSLSLSGHSPQRACVSVHVVNTFLFSLGLKGTIAF